MAFTKLTLRPDREMWERQPGESAAAYARFLAYRDLRPSERAYSHVAESSGRTVRTIEQQGAAHCWNDRAAAWDAHQAQQRRQRLAEQEEEMGRAVMQAARTATAVLVQTLRAISESGEPLDAKDVPRWADAVERLRRIALDRPDQTVEVTGRGGAPIEVDELNNLTPEERRYRIREMTEGIVRAVNDRSTA